MSPFVPCALRRRFILASLLCAPAFPPGVPPPSRRAIQTTSPYHLNPPPPSPPETVTRKIINGLGLGARSLFVVAPNEFIRAERRDVPACFRHVFFGGSARASQSETSQLKSVNHVLRWHHGTIGERGDTEFAEDEYRIFVHRITRRESPGDFFADSSLSRAYHWGDHYVIDKIDNHRLQRQAALSYLGACV